MTPDPARGIPALASLDTPETPDFCVWLLGFSVGQEEPHCLIVKRGDIELHFWKTDRRQCPESTSCYIRGCQVSALLQEFTQIRVPRLSLFEVRSCSVKEFHLRDPHGNLPRSGCAER